MSATAEAEALAAEKHWRDTIYRPDDPQLTVRAVLFGMLVGGVLCLSNLYIVLKTGWSVGVTLTACILGWGFFSLLQRAGLSKRPFGMLENNAMSSVASGAGYMTGGGNMAALPVRRPQLLLTVAPPSRRASCPGPPPRLSWCWTCSACRRRHRRLARHASRVAFAGSLLLFALSCTRKPASEAIDPPASGHAAGSDDAGFDAGVIASDGRGPGGDERVDAGPSRAGACEIAINDCPQRREVAGWIGADPFRISSKREECLARAQAYLAWCGAQLPVAATWWANGKLAGQQVVSPLDGTPSAELLPPESAGLANPLIRFANGKVAGGAPDLYPEYPGIAGFQPTSWFVTQWKKSEHMTVGSLTKRSRPTLDPVFGLAKYAFDAPKPVSHAWFFADPTDPSGKGLVLDFYSSGGLYDSAGGSGQHFSTWLTPVIPVDAPVFLSFNGKLKHLAASTENADAGEGTKVVGIWYSLFTLTFLDPDTRKYTHAFVHILHGDTRDRPVQRHAEFYAFYDQLPATANYINLFAEDVSQYFKQPAPAAALRPVEFDVTKYLCDFVKTPIPRADGTTYTFPTSARKLSNWTISSFATGLETSDTVLDAEGKPHLEGKAEIGFQLSNLHLRKYPGLTRDYAGCTF